jgi:Putative bacterial sensory transduction regulator
MDMDDSGYHRNASASTAGASLWQENEFVGCSGIVYASPGILSQATGSDQTTGKGVAMKTREDIESYLLKLGVTYEDLGHDVWRIKDDGFDNLLVSLAGPVVVFRLKVMDLPQGRREALFETLLRLNAREMVYATFGVDGNAVVLTDSLPLEDLDFSELQAVVDDMGMAISKHYPTLSKFRAAA